MAEKEILMSCEKCGEPILFKDGIYESYVDCRCVRQERIKARIQRFKNLSIIDRENSENVFENAVAETQEEKELLSKFKKYADKFHLALEKNSGILMAGTPGTGKTFYANCIANEIQRKGYSVLSFNLSGYFRKIQESYTKGTDFTEDTLLAAVRDVDLLFIDDLGSEKITPEWGAEKLYNLIDERYRAGKPVIITTNLDTKGLSEHLLVKSSDKLLDRVIGMTTPMILTGKSKRRDRKEAIWDMEL